MKKILSLTLALCLVAGLITGAAAISLDTDREGTPVTLPPSIQRIMAFGPSNTEILAALGVADKLVAIDTYSADVEGVPQGLPLFDMMTPDAEQILALQPDVLFVTGMSQAGSGDPYRSIKEAGVCVLYIPTSSSIAGIQEDIRYIAAVMGESGKGEDVIRWMEEEIAAVKAIGDTVTQKKSVYFEISAAPYMYSFGTGVFLNELLELLGAVNALGDQDSWIAVTDEAVMAANPDVILTSVNYLEDPIQEILARPGWEALNAVKNAQVFSIDANASNRPSQNVIQALWEMALAVYPELYQGAELPQAS